MKYVVTAINRLTGEREAISSPHTRWKAELLLKRAKDLQRKSKKKCAWTNIRLEEAYEEGELKFENVISNSLII